MPPRVSEMERGVQKSPRLSHERPIRGNPPGAGEISACCSAVVFQQLSFWKTGRGVLLLSASRAVEAVGTESGMYARYCL